MENPNFWSFGIPFVPGVLTQRDYFDSLPEEVQQAVNLHPERFQNEEELRAYAERLKKKK